MKKIFTVILVLIVASLGIWHFVYQNPGTMSGEKIYQDAEGKFSFKYPASFIVTGRQEALGLGWKTPFGLKGLLLASTKTPDDYMPNTNLGEARFAVGWSNDPEVIRTCTINTTLEGMDVQDVKINGKPFKKFTTSDAGAGNFYETTTYRTILDGDCWAIEYIIHSGNIYNYPPEAGIKGFDKTKLVSELDGVVKSFKFLVNSD